MKILVLDGINKNTLAIVRHLGKLRIGEIDVVSHTNYSISFYSKFIHERVISPDPKTVEDDFISFLLDRLKNQKYDLLIPVGFKTFEICSKIQHELKKLSKVILTSHDNIKLASSKKETYVLAEKLGISYPKTWYVENKKKIEEYEFNYPSVIKAPFESGVTLVSYANNHADLVDKYHKMCDENDFTEPNLPIIQEFIQGVGYGFFAFYENGTCKRFFMHKRIREYPVTGGPSTCAETYYDDELKNLGMRILDYLEWNGVAMVEFKKDSNDGKYKLMEINPKFWGSLDLALIAGVNFPYFLCKKALNQKIEFLGDYKRIRFQWLLNGDCLHFFENPISLFSILRDVFRSKNDIWISDLKPNLFQILKIFEYLYKRLFK